MNTNTDTPLVSLTRYEPDLTLSVGMGDEKTVRRLENVERCADFLRLNTWVMARYVGLFAALVTVVVYLGLAASQPKGLWPAMPVYALGILGPLLLTAGVVTLVLHAVERHAEHMKERAQEAGCIATRVGRGDFPVAEGDAGGRTFWPARPMVERALGKFTPQMRQAVLALPETEQPGVLAALVVQLVMAERAAEVSQYAGALEVKARAMEKARQIMAC